MRYLETRDLYKVCKELNHTSIKTTEKYATFKWRRLEQDFPSFSKRHEIAKRVNTIRVNMTKGASNPRLMN